VGAEPTFANDQTLGERFTLQRGRVFLTGTQALIRAVFEQAQRVFGFWYGKGPGVDRSGDALKHGNAYGSSPRGGVLVVAGDDHGCVSSSMPHQSDVAFMSWLMPVLSPSSIEEYLEFGLKNGWSTRRLQ